MAVRPHGDLDLPFAEQIEFLRRKLDLPTRRWDDIRTSANDRYFIVAGAQKADLLADLHEAALKAERDGTTLETFRKDFRRIVEERGWHGWTGEGTEAGFNWRTRVIYETNLRTSYAAGRYAQLTDPELLARRPYWKYVHADGVLRPRPQHQAWNGLVLRHDHPFWKTNYPPNGWGCGCTVIAVRAPGDDDKTEPPPGWDKLDAKTGEPPGIDRGWGYAPGASVADELRKIVAEKAAKLPAPLAKELIADGLKSLAFADWYAHPGRGTAWPLARIPDQDARTMGAQDGITVANISSETMEKQKLPGKHPELSAAEYAHAQTVVDNHTNKHQDSPSSMIYVREETSGEAGGHVLVVKATATGKALWITSFRRLPRNEAERDSEIRRLLKKGKK
ncbi:MAG: hypothetical protein LBI92_02555 [Azoarcus sp.]|jgi:hypothetical protein|nr:hypothetical protein [Azoarcus sp.]